MTHTHTRTLMLPDTCNVLSPCAAQIGNINEIHFYEIVLAF